MLHPLQLVRVKVEPWVDALGLTITVASEGATVRLGNGVVIVAHLDDLEEVEFMPGTGVPASFPEDCQGAEFRAVEHHVMIWRQGKRGISLRNRQEPLE